MTTPPTPSLDELTQQARALADAAPWASSGPAPAGPDEAEVSRVMQICNACRFCEGYCAVFPAMTRRLEFSHADTHYLANLCHNCGACLHSCQYAPPNDFAVNVPQAMARVRRRTYQDFAWPRPLGALYARNGLVVAVLLTLALSAFLIATVASQGSLWRQVSDGNFYTVFPHGVLVGLFAPVFLWSVIALALGVRSFWSAVKPPSMEATPGGADLHQQAVAETVHDSLRLRYLEGGHGEGCTNENDGWTLWRRRFHHATFYGFALCFAATCVATAYHYVLGWVAPYPLNSLPVLLGVAGGIGLVIGPVGLLWLNLRRHPDHGDPQQRPMDRAFILLLLLVSVTGLGLLAQRHTAAMSIWLSLHLGAVMALFATLPYGKFAHSVYRVAALLKYSIERRQPSRLKLADD